MGVPRLGINIDHVATVRNAIYYEKKGCCWIFNQNFSEKEIEENLSKIIENRNEYEKKKKNLDNLNYENNWNNVNQKLLEIINEN